MEKLSIQINTKDELKKALMSFIDGKGIFYETDKRFALGDVLEVTLTLPFEHSIKTLTAKVIWVVPDNAQNEFRQGIGLQFSGDDGEQLASELIAEVGEGETFVS